MPAIPFFDTHADTVMRTFDSGLDFVAGTGRAHMDLPRMLQANMRAQLFAVFAVRSHYPEKDLASHAREAIQRIRTWVDTSAGRMRLALNGSDIRAAFSPDAKKAQNPAQKILFTLLGLEGADPLGGQAYNLEEFYNLGVRNVIAAWDDNEFSGSSSGSGSGLTAEGRKLVELCQALHVMVDVSHLSDAAFWQVHEMIRGPFIASHSNCRAIANTPRNLTDEMIQALAGRGGVLGINLYPGFLSPDYAAAWDAIAVPAMAAAKTASEEERERLKQKTIQQLKVIPLPGTEWIARQAAHAIRVGGEDCVGLGGDMDGITAMPAGFTGVESYPLMIDALQNAGLNSRQIEKICWKNMARVFEEVLSG